jgi:RHS repeat-associated protein
VQDGERMKFTGHERDATNLDYMHARSYLPWTGRFLSVDPGGFDPSQPQSWNRYAYVLNNPVGKIDPNGRDTWDVVNGAVKAFTNDMSLGTAPRLNGNGDFESGQQIGDLLALTANAAEVVGGANGTVGSLVLDATGVGAAVGVPAGVVSAAVAAHGTVSGTIALAHLSQSVGGPKRGSSGGPGAGKNFSPSTKEEARAQSGNRCVFCGTDTARKPGPNQSNIDHADPKSRGGNNTLDNAQNTCRTCNLKKAVKTTLEFLNRLVQ